MTTKKNILTVLLIIIGSTAFSQYVTLISNNTMGVEGSMDMLKHSNSCFYLVGGTNFGPFGDYDITVSKMDTNNNLVWSKAYGDANDDIAVEIVELNDSNILVIGFKPNPGNFFSSLILKLDQNGDTLWSQNIYDSTQHVTFNYLDNIGDTIRLFGGYGDNKNKGGIIAINSLAGDIIWSKSYEIPNNLSTIFYQGITRKANNKSYLLVRTVTDSITLSDKAFLCSFDLAGNPIDVISIADSCGFSSPLLNVSEQTGDIFIGVNVWRNTGFTGENYLLCRFDSAGQLKYAKEIGPGIYSFSFQSAVLIDSINMLILSNGRNIFNIDSIGKAINCRRFYYDPAFPSALCNIKKMIVSNNKLIGVGSIRNTNNSPVNIIYFKSELDGTGCQNILFSDSTVDFPLFMTQDSMSVDTITNLYEIAGINYSTINIGFDIKCQTNIGLNEADSKIEFFIYPNPFFDQITINYSNKRGNYDLQIFDCLGRKVFQKNMYFKSETETINLNYLPPALYHLAITDIVGNTISKRIIKY